MNMAEAKQIAREWVLQERNNVRGYQGAFFIGSTNTRADNSPQPKTSDIDICFCLEEGDAELLESLHQTLAVKGIVIDRSARPMRDFQDAQSILRSPWLAFHFAMPSIIDDPTGRLALLQKEVATQYSQRQWVEQRCAVVAEEFEFARQLLLAPESHPLYSYGPFWPSMALAELLIVADLGNPTVGKGLILARSILEAQGARDRHEELLALLGCAEMGQSQVWALFEECVAAYECAGRVHKSYVYEDYITNPAERSTGVGKVQEMIETGNHQEAVASMAYIRSVCQLVIENDASSAEQKRYRRGFQELLQALGFISPADRVERAALAQETYKHIDEVIQLLIRRNSTESQPAMTGISG